MRNRLSRATAVVAALACAPLAACGGGSAARSPSLAQTDVQLRMRDFKLPSGLRVIVEEDHAAPIAAVINFVGVGSSADPVGKEGLAHLVEHLAFRAKHAGMHGRTVWTLLEMAGGGAVNAWTGLDATAYHEAGSRDSLPDLLAIETMRMTDPLEGVDEAVFATEREVVRNELRQRSEMGYAGTVMAEVQAALFPVGHKYARPAVGTHASLSALTLDDAKAFVAQHYTPSNMTLVVEGDVDLAKIGKLLDARVPAALRQPSTAAPPGGATSARLPPQAPKPPEPPPVGPSGLRKIESDVATPMLVIGWSLPRSYDSSSLPSFVAAVAGNALSRAWGDDTDIVGVSVDLVRGAEASMLLCQVTLREGTHPEKSFDHVLNHLQETWSPEDGGSSARMGDVVFDINRRLALTNLLFDAENGVARGTRRAELAHFTGELTAYAARLRDVSTLNRGTVARYAYDYLTRDRARAVLVTKAPEGARGATMARTTGVARPEDDAEPVTYDVASIATVAVGPGMGSFRSFVLPNGLEVIIGRHGSLPIANVGLLFKGGASLEEKKGAAELASNIAGGGKPLHGHFYSYGAQMHSSLRDDAATRMVSLPAQNLGDALAVLADEVAHYRATDESRNLFGRYTADFLSKWDARPESAAQRAFQKAIFGEHVYGHVATSEEMRSLNAGDANRWIARTLAPANGVLAIVGGIDPYEAEQLARKWFGDWSGDAKAAPLPPPPAPAPTQRVVVTNRPASTQAEITLGCPLPLADARKDAVYDIAASAMATRLFSAIRGDMGASYGFHGFAETLRGGASHIEIEGNVENGKLAPALRVIRRMLDAKGGDVLPTQLFDQARWLSAERYNVGLASSAALVRAVLTTRNNEQPLATIDERPLYLATMTKDAVASAMTTCAQNAVISVVGDEEKIRAAIAAEWH